MQILDNYGFMKRPRCQFSKKMVHFGLLAVLVLSASSCRKTASAPPAAPPVISSEEALRQADDLYARREDLMNVRKAIVALKQAQAGEPPNYDLAWRLAKLNYYIGAHSSDASEKDKAFHDGIEAGKLAVQLSGDKPDGHFWLGANYGGNAQINTLAGLADVEDIKREMETVLKMDERYQAGSAYMVLGEVYLEAPRLLGGDTEKAIENLEKGKRAGPDNALIRSHLAQAYAQANRPDDARKEIEALLAMKPAAGYEPEYNEAVTQARTLQQKLK